jgi:hypothetical protein
VIKDDLMALFTDFHKGELPLHSLNFGTIILIPKSKEAKQIQQYRLICLLNVSFKISTKVVANQIVKIAERIIKPSQTTFLPRRNIMEGTVYMKPYTSYIKENIMELSLRLILKRHMIR